MTTQQIQTTSLVRTSTDITFPNGSKQYITVEMQITVPAGASDDVIRGAVDTARRTITMAQEEVQHLLHEQVGQIRVAHTNKQSEVEPALFEEQVDDANFVIGFGKNKGTKLGALTEQSLAWYAYDMKPNNDDGKFLQEAAQRLYETNYGAE